MAKQDQFGKYDAQAFREMASLAGQIASATEIYRENLRQVGEYSSDIKDALTGQNRAALDLQRVSAEQLRNKETQRRIEKSLEKTQGVRNQLLGKQEALQKKIQQDQKSVSESKKLAARLESELVGLSGKARKTAAQRLALAKQSLIENQDRLQQSQEAADITREALGDNEKLLEVYKGISDEIKVVNSKTKFFDRLKDAVKSIPGAGPLISGPFEKAAEAASEAAASGKGLLATYRKGFAALEKSLGKLFFITVFTKSIFEADKGVTSISKNLGVSRKSALGMYQSMAQFAEESDSVAVSSITMMKAFGALAPMLGQSVLQNKELLSDFAKSTELIGLTVESAAKLSELALSSGMGLRDFQGAAIKAANSVEGINTSAKEVLTDISQLSAETLINFGRNPEELGKAVNEARKLGISLEKVKDIGEALLNFESSIANELEAELLTGRELNLEKARLAALTGDQATLMKEIATQAGTLADFEKMNVLARQSLAKSLNMSVSEMGAMLIRQEAINAGSEDAKNLTDEQLRSAQALVKAGQARDLNEASSMIAEQADATQTMQLAMMKIQGILANLSTIAMPFIDAFAAGAELVAKHFRTILTLAAAYKVVQIGINTYKAAATAMAARELAMEQGKVIQSRLRVALEGESLLAKRLAYLFTLRSFIVEKGKMAIEKASAIIARIRAGFDIASAVAKISGQSALTFGAAAIAAAGAAAAAYAFLKPKKVGDMGIDPNGGPVAYDPNSGGLFQGKKSDGMSMGPEFGIEGGPSGEGSSTAGLITELRAMRKTLETLATREGTVYIDGNKAGKALALQTYRSS